MKPWLKKTALAAVAAILTVGALEVAARLYLVWMANDATLLRYGTLAQIRRRGIPQHLSPHRYLGVYPTPDYSYKKNRHNQLGFRGDEIVQPKPAQEFRIVCLGASATYSFPLEDYRQAYPVLLEENLTAAGLTNVKVVNGGVQGWTSLETLIDFQTRVLDLSPDMIIVYQGANDLRTQFVWPPESYRSDQSGRRGPISLETPPARWIESSTLARVILIRTGLSDPQNTLDLQMAGGARSYAEEFARQLKLRTYPSGIFAEVSAAAMLKANPPIYFRRNLENLVVLAKARGIQVLLVTYASLPEFANDPLLGSEEGRAGLEAINRITADVAGEQGVHLFDFADRYPRKREYFVDSQHFSKEGTAMQAKLISEFIIQKQLIKTKAPAIPR